LSPLYSKNDKKMKFLFFVFIGEKRFFWGFVGEKGVWVTTLRGINIVGVTSRVI